MPESINPAIFKAYDIRGVYPEEINEDAAYLIGRAYVKYLEAKVVVVGRDMRVSSPSLFEALSRGITDQGADVIDIGMVATPMLSFFVMNGNYPAGIMISASHNPGKYNAFKLIKNNGPCSFQLYGEKGINDIRDLVMAGDFQEAEEKGKITKADAAEDYHQFMLEKSGDIRGLKVVVDYGNGVGSLSSDFVLSSLPIETISLFKDPDGNFPNHEPNPHEVENLKTLQEKVISEKASLGIFFDGDADRSLIVDESGQIIFPDVVLGVLAKDELMKNPGKKVFYDLRFTKCVAEEVKKDGGAPEMMRVGNPFYKEALLADDGLLAGEFSGHIMFKEFWAIDDGLFSALKFMSIMSREGKKASELAEPFKRCFQTEEINMQVEDADKTFEQVKAKYADGKLVTIDGLLISYDDWWLSLRKSNTEPLVRLRLEADTKELMEKKKEEVLSVIRG